MGSSTIVREFGEGAPEPAQLGGKGAALSRLVGLGHRVPPGFVVTVDAFRSTIDHLGLSDALAALMSGPGADEATAAAERIRSELERVRLPSFVIDPVVDAVERLGLWEPGGRGLIVRSSATVEDSSGLSFAGIFESILAERPEDLEPTIREVWSSLLSPRALAYARESGLAEFPAMAVVVQRFLDADRSGVMFTRFSGPDGLERILVEHVEGDCEKLVKGEVTPDRLWLDWGAEVEPTLEGALRPVHAGALARLAGSLEDSMGGPQDVEWCVYEGEVHVLQSRPITAAFRPAAPSATPPLDARPVLTGVPASPGTGTGPVHLVFNIEQALDMERGRVLVTPMTNPDMVVAMRNSAAIVTDVGGMICHAAIVSRELGLPCVVGTETATSTLASSQVVTVDGSAGAVYDGALVIERVDQNARPAGWEDLWAAWTAATGGRSDLVPMVSTVDALAAAPPGMEAAVLAPDVDLRAGRYGLWQDLEGLSEADRRAALDGFAARLADVVADRKLERLTILPIGTVPAADLGEAVRRLGDPRIAMHPDDPAAPPVVFEPGPALPAGAAAVPLGAVAARATRGAGGDGPSSRGVEGSLNAALDTIRFFGHRPGVKVTSMPDPIARRRWWALLPEYGQFHGEFGTPAESGEFEWLEVRPELVISAMLKSLVQPGFEMVPRALGFRGIGPMHIKWIRCRYHFRADVFARVWEAIVRSTYDPAWMADLMRRVRASYDRLAEVLLLFPETDQELRALTGQRIVALITSWWPRWVEFFALCWFIQAQGDDIAYPFVEETVADNLARAGDPPDGLSWPGARDLIAPTTPVMSGAYMADVAALRERLLEAGLSSADDAVAALDRGEQPALGRTLAEHLRKWHWMRDRDLLFEPWDSPRRVIETALRTEPHAAVPYEENLRRNLLSLGFHVDLAHATGRAAGVAHMARFLHDLNVERENHHILWLKYSYPLRRVLLEVERRLVELGSLDPGDVFFLQAPELIEAARNLPAPLDPEVVARAKNRRLGFQIEARLAAADAGPAADEDDYY